MKKRVIFLFAILVFGCAKIDLSPNELDEILVIGHGGMGFMSPQNPLPENSLESIKEAMELLRADGVEVDVQVSAEGTLWLYHDEFLQTMTNCQGCLSEKTDAELRQCRYRNFLANSGPGPKLITLAELFAYFQSYPEFPLLVLDLKVSSPCADSAIHRQWRREKFAAHIDSLARHFRASERILVTTPNFLALQAVRQLNDKILLYAEIGGEDYLDEILRDGFDGVIVYNERASAERIHMFKGAGLGILLFNMKTRQGISEAINKQPDMLMTDNIRLTRQLLGRND